ncbi:MAG: hypothetical protein COU28_03600 [Candidatus Magasanikbacteria bacterium CG10_big_fil_rev_8_21_14_0_10_36_16]|uniref:TrbC/VIRB2 family protein n=1 Tax=Candidatus Magasanikbacteria bacterium CG10_big_fil_rev_8_21_14_0_10_36_16 TaxID=1974645 RepID=A0A2H0TXY2_9BACT|nr:MAG: hypothetical protein COU28_03600 [Candidatus Magasanikbacteria bacterium CG10_big_fil_rev_8_21_14_0_10_36_16]
MKNKKMSSIFFTILFSISFLTFIPNVFADAGQPPTIPCNDNTDLLGLDCVGQNSKLSANDPRIIVTHIINVSLSLLGIIVTVLIIYAGFLWMTAGGDEAQAGKARKIIFAAVIGLIIILLAYAITRFVAINLYQATIQ